MPLWDKSAMEVSRCARSIWIFVDSWLQGDFLAYAKLSSFCQTIKPSIGIKTHKRLFSAIVTRSPE